MVHLVVAGSIVGYSAYVHALRHLPVSTVSLYAYANPIIAVVLGTVLLSEPFSTRIVLAAALVFSGIAVVRSAPATRRRRRQRGKKRHERVGPAAPLRLTPRVSGRGAAVEAPHGDTRPA